MSKQQPPRHENAQQDDQKNASRTEAPSQAIGQNQTQTELDKYRGLRTELLNLKAEVELLHEQRAGFQAKAEALKAERAELQSKLLDGEDPNVVRELVLLEDSERLTTARLSGIEPRIERTEEQLQTRLPQAIATFQRLRDFVSFSTLESCRASVRSLIAADYVVEDSHVDAVAITMPAYVAVSRIQLPGAGWMLTRSLTEVPVPFGNMAKPYSAAEIASMRAQTVDSLIAATNALLEAARALNEAAGPFGDLCPPFRCEAEVVPIAAADPEQLKWLEPIGGSDLEFARVVAKTAGKVYEELPPEQKAIVDAMVLERRKQPISHGFVTGWQMVGTTTDARLVKEPHE